MIFRRHILGAAALIYASAIIQARLAHTVRIGVAEPDFILVVTSCASVLIGGPESAFLGVFSGLLTGALGVFNLGSTLASRTMAAAASGWMHDHVIRKNISVPPLIVLMASLTSNIVYVLMAPPPHLKAWALTACGQTLYDILLAVPIYFGLRRLGFGSTKIGAF